MEKTYTTEPKTRRHSNFISGDRCRTFMRHLWEKGLKKTASPDTLKFEFTMCFETNDKRTIVKYLGQPKKIERYSASEMVRVNRVDGRVAQFNYQHKRYVPHSTGLLEQLSYVTYSQEGKCYRLNHELMPYYTHQVTLATGSGLQEVNEGLVPSKDSACVSVDLETAVNGEAGEGRVQGKKEEEVIDSTHANPYYATNMNCPVSSRSAQPIVVRGNDSMESLEKEETVDGIVDAC